MFIVKQISFQKLFHQSHLLIFFCFHLDALNFFDSIQYFSFGIPAETFNVLSVVNNGGIDCCLVVKFNIFWGSVFRISFLGPRGEESVAVDSTRFILDFEERLVTGWVNLIKLTVLVIVLDYSIQVVLESEQLVSRAPSHSLLLCSPSLYLLLFTFLRIFLTFEDKIFHNVLNFHPDESTSDWGELNSSGRSFNRLEFKEIFRRKNLNRWREMKGDDTDAYKQMVVFHEDKNKPKT